MTRRLNHVSVTCGSLDRSLDFYVGLLGLEVTSQGERTSATLDTVIGLGPVRLRSAELAIGDDGGGFLELFEYLEPRGTPAVSRTCDPGSVHFAVEVDDIDATHRLLTEAGVVTRSQPVLITRGEWIGARAFYALDPDGVTVECIEFPLRTEHNRVLILQHEASAPASSFADWARSRGYAVEVLMAGDGEWADADFSSVAFLATLGSASASYDDGVPWLARELELLEQAHSSDVPVFGICFGSQILARSLGAHTRLAPSPEIGWFEVELTDGAPIPPGPWLFWHIDQFDVPPGAELLARTAAGPAAFRAGHSMAVQFHPEATRESLEAWIESSGADLDPAVLQGLSDGHAAERPVYAERAFELYDLFLANALATRTRAAHQPSRGEDTDDKH
jgi:GMP synthase-like glutamine amidotransferase/catechol 2,3-dioxygenase-like lactoylglutathione lyase family enzyme